jgi:hypothetical protein
MKKVAIRPVPQSFSFWIKCAFLHLTNQNNSFIPIQKQKQVSFEHVGHLATWLGHPRVLGVSKIQIFFETKKWNGMVSMSEVGQIQQKLTKSNEIKSLRFFKKGEILMHRLLIQIQTLKEKWL